ncbi:ubiquinol oxidase subunit II [Buchnera aphidicola (Hormaphis cornu)]|nr:ubiquinol oxidase subunit II [Buchnera aphidicola (Hormaphis cornu)]
MKFLGLICKILLLISASCLLSGCQPLILDSYGAIGMYESSIFLKSFIVMLIIVIPVIIMTFYFVIKFSSKTTNVQYSPNWSHSNKIEIIVWGVPIIAILFLAHMAWYSTNFLEPRKPIKNFSINSVIKVDVIALDWKWLFIYPELQIATINKLVFPVKRPMHFRITSYSVMNSFFVPLLGSQIYAMPGMITNLNLIANKIGVLKGISSNFSGKGFSGMKFSVIITQNKLIFNNWINLVKKSSNKLMTLHDLKKIMIPDENHMVEYFSDVNPKLFNTIVKKMY